RHLLLIQVHPNSYLVGASGPHKPIPGPFTIIRHCRSLRLLPSPNPTLTTASPRITASAIFPVQCSRNSLSKSIGTTAKPLSRRTHVAPSIRQTSILLI